MRLPLLIALLVAQPAIAADVSVAFSGQISSLTYADCQVFANGNCSQWAFSSIQSTDFLEGSVVSVDQAFTGSFGYDSNATMAPLIGDGFQGVYLNATTASSFSSSTLQLPNASFSSTATGNVSVVNGRDGYDALLIQDFYSNADFFVSMYTFQQDSTGTVFSSFALPTNLSMSAFNNNGFSFGFLRRADGDQVQISGSLSSINITSAVPEPSSTALLAAGLLAVVLNARARGRAQA